MQTVRLAADGGRYIHYGVREFGMAAIMNGINTHGGFLAFGGTFLTFSDYMRNAIRMAAIMKLQIDLRVHARLDRSRRGRPDAPGRSSTRPRCG